MAAPTFAQLWSAYPIEPDKASLFAVLGGGWPALIPNMAYDNTCTVRLSMALNRCGSPVSAAKAALDGNHRDGAGNFICTRVPTAEKLVVERYGATPYWGMSHQPDTDLDLSTVPATNGILIYRVNPATYGAYGHVDLWPGAEPCRVDCNAPFARYCYEIALWKLA